VNDTLYAPDAAEQLRRWDAGESIWSIEMGGLGPGYEQAIQVLAVEIMRDWLGKELPEKVSTSDLADATIARLPDGGYSGAQVGAAAQLAYKWLSDGPAACMGQVEDDRHIQVSRAWPNVGVPA
jgi:hypothetical protein